MDNVFKRIVQAMEDDHSPGNPKYEKLSRAIFAEIERGNWKPGAKLPADTAFADVLPISLLTIQKALKKLEADGVVVRRHRVGTFVRDGAIQDSDIKHLRFLTLGEPTLAPLMVRVIDITPAHADTSWRHTLDVMGKLVRIRRICTINAEFRVFIESYLRADRFGALLKASPANIAATPLSSMLGERFNAPTIRSDHRLKLSACVGAPRKWLEIPSHAPVIDWRMYCYSYGNELILAQRVTVPQTRSSIQIVELVQPP